MRDNEPAIIGGGAICWLCVGVIAIGMVGLALCWLVPVGGLR